MASARWHQAPAVDVHRGWHGQWQDIAEDLQEDVKSIRSSLPLMTGLDARADAEREEVRADGGPVPAVAGRMSTRERMLQQSRRYRRVWGLVADQRLAVVGSRSIRAPAFVLRQLRKFVKRFVSESFAGVQALYDTSDDEDTTIRETENASSSDKDGDADMHIRRHLPLPPPPSPLRGPADVEVSRWDFCSDGSANDMSKRMSDVLDHMHIARDQCRALGAVLCQRFCTLEQSVLNGYGAIKAMLEGEVSAALRRRSLYKAVVAAVAAMDVPMGLSTNPAARGDENPTTPGPPAADRDSSRVLQKTVEFVQWASQCGIRDTAQVFAREIERRWTASVALVVEELSPELDPLSTAEQLLAVLDTCHRHLGMLTEAIGEMHVTAVRSELARAVLSRDTAGLVLHSLYDDSCRDPAPAAGVESSALLVSSASGFIVPGYDMDQRGTHVDPLQLASPSGAVGAAAGGEGDPGTRRLQRRLMFGSATDLDEPLEHSERPRPSPSRERLHRLLSYGAETADVREELIDVLAGELHRHMVGHHSADDDEGLHHTVPGGPSGSVMTTPSRAAAHRRAAGGGGRMPFQAADPSSAADGIDGAPHMATITPVLHLVDAIAAARKALGLGDAPSEASLKKATLAELARSRFPPVADVAGRARHACLIALGGALERVVAAHSVALERALADVLFGAVSGLELEDLGEDVLALCERVQSGDRLVEHCKRAIAKHFLRAPDDPVGGAVSSSGPNVSALRAGVAGLPSVSRPSVASLSLVPSEGGGIRGVATVVDVHRELRQWLAPSVIAPLTSLITELNVAFVVDSDTIASPLGQSGSDDLDDDDDDEEEEEGGGGGGAPLAHDAADTESNRNEVKEEAAVKMSDPAASPKQKQQRDTLVAPLPNDATETGVAGLVLTKKKKLTTAEGPTPQRPLFAVRCRCLAGALWHHHLQRCSMRGEAPPASSSTAPTPSSDDHGSATVVDEGVLHLRLLTLPLDRAMQGACEWIHAQYTAAYPRRRLLWPALAGDVKLLFRPLRPPAVATDAAADGTPAKPGAAGSRAPASHTSVGGSDSIPTATAALTSLLPHSGTVGGPAGVGARGTKIITLPVIAHALLAFNHPDNLDAESWLSMERFEANLQPLERSAATCLAAYLCQSGVLQRDPESGALRPVADCRKSKLYLTSGTWAKAVAPPDGAGTALQGAATNAEGLQSADAAATARSGRSAEDAAFERALRTSRQRTVEAVVVKTLKARRCIDMLDLSEEVMTVLKGRFQLEQRMLKAAVEWLVEREYATCNTDVSPAVLTYVV